MDTGVHPFAGIVKKTGIVFFSVYLIGLGFNLTQKRLWTIPKGFGLYSQEDWNGKQMQWMAKKAEYYLPSNTRELNLHVVAQPFNSQPPEGLTLSISVDEKVIDQVNFIDGGTQILKYDLSTLNSGGSKVTLEVDKVFCPRKIGLNDDPRILGVAVGIDS